MEKDFAEYFYNGREQKVDESKRDWSHGQENVGINRERIIGGTRKEILRSTLQRSRPSLCYYKK